MHQKEGMSEKLNIMTWRFEWITLSKNFSSKSFWDFESQNLPLAGREEEDEERQREIGFFEGTDFLGAIVRKSKGNSKKTKEHSKRNTQER